MNPIWFVIKFILYTISAVAISWFVAYQLIKYFYPLGKESLENSLTEIGARYILILLKPVTYLLSFVGAFGALDLQKLSGSGLILSYRYSSGITDYLSALIIMLTKSLSNVTIVVLVFLLTTVVFRLVSFYKAK